MYKYPVDDFDRPNKMLGMLGTFWSELYHGRDIVLGKLAANMERAQHTRNAANTVADNCSWHTAPVFRREPWHMIVISEQDMLAVSGQYANYGDDYVYDGTLQYATKEGAYRVSAPQNLKSCRMICDGMTRAGVTLFAPMDFILDEDDLIFSVNPFAYPFDAENVYADGTLVDRVIRLWLYDCEFDDNNVYQQYGHVLEYNRPSSDAYKLAVAATLDCLSQGTAKGRFDDALAAIFGITLCHTDGEIVEQISATPDKLLVITDQNVYAFRADLTPVVATGQALKAGQSLVEQFNIHELRRGQLPTGVDALAIPTYLLDVAVHDDIVFENTNVPVTVTVVNEKELITFPVGGAEDDVAAFWAGVRAREDAHNITLAARLRELYGRVPATINPMEFLIKHVWRWNCLIVTATKGATSNDAAAIPYNLLRMIQPPHTLVIFVIKLPQLVDTVPSTGFIDGPAIIGVSTTTGSDTLAISEGAMTCKQLDFGCQ